MFQRSKWESRCHENYKLHLLVRLVLEDMNMIADTLNHFNTTTLESLDVIKLLKRYDTKFLFCRDKLPAVFDFLSDYYYVLEIKNRRYFQYESLYYDTDDFYFYHQHHNKKYDRYKIRFRKYIDSNQCYFEVKHKNNKRKTIKSRLLLDDNRDYNELSEESKLFARNSMFFNNGDIIDRIKPKLEVSFDRITFANLENKERLTIDVNLAFTNKNSFQKKIDNLVIAELKSEKYSYNSLFTQYLKGLKIYPARFSKYCMGIAITEKDIKYNRFKKKILKLNNLN